MYKIESDNHGFRVIADESLDRLELMVTQLTTVEDVLKDYSNQVVDVLDTDIKKISDLVNSARELITRSRKAIQTKIDAVDYKDEVIKVAVERMHDIDLYTRLNDKQLADLAGYAVTNNLKIVNKEGLKDWVIKELKKIEDVEELIERLFTKEAIIKQGQQQATKQLTKKDAYDAGYKYYKTLMANRNSRHQAILEFVEREMSKNSNFWLNKYYGLK
jgi:hypothetical protein